MKREVKFSLVFRDMWQSAGKYVPRVDQLVKVAPAIIEMGCFARVETNGGGFEQVNLLFGENPNRAVREWTKPFHEAGIQTHMLDRALNGLRMSPVPADVRKLFYKVKKAQGTDITRTFCGLNDVRNIAPSITYAKEAGMISQCSLCITHSPIHTVEYYTNMALELIKLGADEICIKDMAGIGRPVSLGKIVANIKAAHPEIPVQYHSHAGPGFNMASILEVCEAGCDYIDVGMEPLSWGTGHADLLSVQAMLKDAGFKVPEINMEAYMKVRGMIQEFMDGQEYGADVYIDLLSGKCTSIFVKKKIKMRAGETDKSVSVKDEALFSMIRNFVEACGFRGMIDIDIFKIDGIYYLSEVNPRFGGGYPHAYEAGVNMPEQVLMNLKGEENPVTIGDYEEGICMMKYNEVMIRRIPEADIV